MLVLIDSLSIVVLRYGGENIGNSKSDLKICMMWAILVDIHTFIKYTIEGAFLLSQQFFRGVFSNIKSYVTSEKATVQEYNLFNKTYTKILAFMVSLTLFLPREG